MIVSEIELFSLLKTKLGEQEAKALVEFVEAKAESKAKEVNDANLKTISTKADIIQLEVKIAETKVELIKWMVALIVGLFLALIGSLTAIIKIIVH